MEERLKREKDVEVERKDEEMVGRKEGGNEEQRGKRGKREGRKKKKR